MLDLRVHNFEFSMSLILRQNCECRKKYTHTHTQAFNPSRKQKGNPITGLDRPTGLQEVEAPRFLDIRHMKVVRFQPHAPAALTAQEIPIALISVRG